MRVENEGEKDHHGVHRCDTDEPCHGVGFDRAISCSYGDKVQGGQGYTRVDNHPHVHGVVPHET